MQVLLANPRGFCAGVDRAIEIVERAIALFGAPIYVRHEVVHNRHVVDRLRELGAVFVEELQRGAAGATVIFSAHGVSHAVEDEAKERGLTVFDATCPLVTKVHMEVQRYAREGREVILIGHAGHPEVEGTMGRFDTSFGGRMYLVGSEKDVGSLDVRDPANLAFVTQTTLSVDDTTEIVAALRRRFPLLATPRKEDICYATQNRQDAVKKLLAECDLLVVVGSKSSSNSNRLRELAERLGYPGLSRRRSGGPQARVVRGQAAPSASPPGRRRRRFSCSAFSSSCVTGARRCRARSRAARSGSPSGCRASCGARGADEDEVNGLSRAPNRAIS